MRWDIKLRCIIGAVVAGIVIVIVIIAGIIGLFEWLIGG